MPNFERPPLEEVVLGVQFETIPNYKSIFAHEIRNLFKSSHPIVSEQAMLPPNFESFGGRNPQPSFQVQFGSPPVGSRQWFATEEGNDLIQFQSDRFIANWRKLPRPQDYPRFEGISKKFEENLRSLDNYVIEKFGTPLSINQSEVAYINIIPVNDFSDAINWFKLWDNGKISLENLNINFDEVVKNAAEKPFARLKHHIQSVYSADGNQRAFRLSLTFIGKPDSTDLDSAMAFIRDGRERIVTRFGMITTEKAQLNWGRTS